MIALRDSIGSNFLERVRGIFAPEGLLSKARNFEYRPQQQAMAGAVAEALEEERHLVVEAGTGVGKSLAYLVPATLFAIEQTCYLFYRNRRPQVFGRRLTIPIAIGTSPTIAVLKQFL